jgi:hypothetical protein
MDGFFDFSMVQPTGLEPVTSSFAGRRSNPTELRLHIFRMCGLYVFFGKCKRKLASRHSIEVKSFEIRHRFCEEVFLFSFSEESSLVDDTLLNE